MVAVAAVVAAADAPVEPPPAGAATCDTLAALPLVLPAVPARLTVADRSAAAPLFSTDAGESLSAAACRVRSALMTSSSSGAAAAASRDRCSVLSSARGGRRSRLQAAKHATTHNRQTKQQRQVLAIALNELRRRQQSQESNSPDWPRA